jgi:hypothetical protein
MASVFGIAPPANPIARRAAIAAVLLLVGVALAAGYRVVSGTQRQAFSVGAVPPSSSRVTEGKTYQLAVPGGVTALQKHRVNVTTPQCEWSLGGSGNQLLQVTASGPNTKAINVVGTFVSPVTGDIHVDCAGWGAMYIDDADNAPADVAGWLLVLAVLALGFGAGLGVSALRMAGDDAASGRWSPREDDEIQRLVDVVHVRSQDGEVADSDRDNVGP